MDAAPPDDHAHEDMRARMTSSPDTLAKADQAPPCTMVIFGAGGDLTKRLLMPSLYNLRRAGLLPDGFSVIAVDHNENDDARYRDYLPGAVTVFKSLGLGVEDVAVAVKVVEAARKQGVGKELPI